MNLSRLATLSGAHTSRRAAAIFSTLFSALRARLHFRTTAFRWFAAYAAIFSLALVALLGVIGYSAMVAMQREADSGLRWQLRYFDGYADAGLPQVIGLRIARPARQTSYYGLFAPDGRKLAGEIRRVPPGLRLELYGQPHDEATGVTLPISLDTRAANLPVRARVLGERRADGSQLVVARTLDDENRVRAELMRALVGGGLICLAGGLAAGLSFGVRQMRRVGNIRRALVRIASGDLAARLPVSAAGRDELDMLGRQVNQMLDEIERLMGEVKSTCDMVAHDLRTPLIHLKTRLAAMPDTSRCAELMHAREDVDALLGRFTALLRISGIEARQRRSAFASVSLRALVADLCELYAPLAEERQIAFSARLDESAPLLVDRELLFEAFANLVDNALKFTPDGGRVSVTLTNTVHGPQFAVSDTGPGILASERAAVLTRFYRSQRTQHVPGTGLGLGLVAAVARLHDFAFRIGNASNGTGTRVCVDCWPGAASAAPDMPDLPDLPDMPDMPAASALHTTA